MNRVRVVTAAIWCRIATTALAAAIAASPAYGAEPEKTAKRAGKFVEKTATRAGKFTEKTAKRAVKFTKKTAQKTADWVRKQTE
jgi:hydroxymethylpyrimidine/phosphomethylpyrimidine kinase